MIRNNIRKIVIIILTTATIITLVVGASIKLGQLLNNSKIVKLPTDKLWLTGTKNTLVAIWLLDNKLSIQYFHHNKESIKDIRQHHRKVQNYLTSLKSGEPRSFVFAKTFDLSLHRKPSNSSLFFWSDFIRKPNPMAKPPPQIPPQLVHAFLAGWPGRWGQLLFPLWILFLILSAYPTAVFIRGPLLHHLRRKKGHCIKCGYNLTGNVTGICPECGEKI